MNKKLLTAAIGAALVAGPMLAAQAKVTVYGAVQFELASEDVDNTISGQNDNFIVRTNRWNGGAVSPPNNHATDGSVLTLQDNQRGRFGIKASEDLGGGLKGFIKIEYDISADGTANAQNSNFGAHPGIREANVGLKGSWGTFTIGTLKTPYKYWGGVKYDPFVTTNLEARRNGGMTGGAFGQNAFAQDVISYMSPGKKGPFKVWAVYSPDEQGGTSVGPGSANGWDDGDYSIGVKGGYKNWEVFGVTTKNKDNAVAGLDYDATKVGGMWKSGPHKIVAQFEDTSFDSAAGVTDDGELLFVGYHLKFGGNNTLVVQFGDGELKRNTSATTQEWTYIMAGVIHKFSKKTRVFAGYSTTELDNQGFTAANDGDRTVLSVGLRKDF